MTSVVYMSMCKMTMSCQYDNAKIKVKNEFKLQKKDDKV